MLYFLVFILFGWFPSMREDLGAIPWPCVSDFDAAISPLAPVILGGPAWYKFQEITEGAYRSNGKDWEGF